MRCSSRKRSGTWSGGSGFGAAVLVGRDVITGIDKGGNMAAPLLAESLGGTFFLGFIAAVAFATILAVVAGSPWPAPRPCRTTST